MTPNPSATLTAPAFSFLSQLTRRLHGRATAPSEALAAVGLLTATADPARADRLRPRPGEPAPLVERLAVWALHRVDDDTVVLAQRLLQGDDQPVAAASRSAASRSAGAVSCLA